jgi:hypothetical protein
MKESTVVKGISSVGLKRRRNKAVDLSNDIHFTVRVFK